MIGPLATASRVYLDTAPLIYFVEENPRYCAIVEPLMDAIDQGSKHGLSSYLTLLEVLVKPLQEKRTDLATKYRDLLLGCPRMRMLAIDAEIAQEAARIRADYNFKTPDAIQLATARRAAAEVFVTNDDGLRRYREVPILVLNDHVPPP